MEDRIVTLYDHIDTQEKEIKDLKSLVEKKDEELKAKDIVVDQRSMEASMLWQTKEQFENDAELAVTQLVEYEEKIKHLQAELVDAQKEARRQVRLKKELQKELENLQDSDYVHVHISSTDDDGSSIKSSSCASTPGDETQAGLTSVTNAHPLHVTSEDGLQALPLPQDDWQARYEDLKKSSLELGELVVERESRLKKQEEEITQLKDEIEVCMHQPGCYKVVTTWSYTCSCNYAVTTL